MSSTPPSPSTSACAPRWSSPTTCGSRCLSGSELATVGDLVHGGAISSLVDTAATLAAWSGLESLDNVRGTTISLAVTFMSAARGSDLVADARVVRRGKTICFCEVDVRDGGARRSRRA